MAKDTITLLKNGEVDFLFYLTDFDHRYMVEKIRNHPDRLEIITNSYDALYNAGFIGFCLDIIYDMPEFADKTYELLQDKGLFRHMIPKKFSNMLNKSPVGLKILNEKFEEIIYTLEENSARSECRTEPDGLDDLVYYEKVIEYACNSKNKKLLHKLSIYPDLHMRFLFMEYLIDHHPEMIDSVYDDITKYMTSVTYEKDEQLTYLPVLMDQREVSKLAVKLLGNNRSEDYEKLRAFILREYDSNNLAQELLDNPFKEIPGKKGCHVVDKEKEAIQVETFNKDAATLFNTSANYRFHILFNFNDNIDKEILDAFANQMRYFIEIEDSKDFPKWKNEYLLRSFERSGLVGQLATWTEKYMDLSKSKDYGFVGSGTTSACYRIGDYIIKIVRTKWSYEDVICPNLYLIAKNYEEVYMRESDGIVSAGIEVQKYLTRSAIEIDPEYFKHFDEELNRLGYRRTDALIFETGENVKLLDSYKDADCSNPDGLPDWFKKYPIVLVDRDRIYPKNKRYIKQLSSGASY